MTAIRGLSDTWPIAESGHSARPLDPLSAAALAYLALPLVLFCGGWLKPAYAALACLLLAVAAAAALRPRQVSWRLPLPASTLALAAAAGFAWAGFGGAGHFLYANTDWPMRDAVLMDLVHAPWPPSYAVQGGEHVILRTALAYFLPAAAMGALLGAQHADLILYLWTGLGVALFLALLPLPERPGARLALALAVIVLFSGMDAVGVALIAGYVPAPPMHLEWWAYPLQYSSHATQLFWVPNHALPGWIAAALVFRHWREPAFWPVAVLLLALLPLWTPFAALGMTPFLAALAADRLRRGLGLRLPPAVLLPALLLLALQVRYLGLGFEVLEASTPAQVVFEPARAALKYLRFVLLEFGVLALGLAFLARHSRGLLAVAAAVLTVLPLISFGPSNDVVMRASIPSLALLAILCVCALQEADSDSGRRMPRLLVIVALAVGAVTPAYEFWRALARPRWAPAIDRTLPEAARGLPAHYVGRLDRWDLKAIMRTPAPVTRRDAIR